MIPVAFDLRDPVRSGLARVAVSLARAFTESADGRFAVTLAGPVATLTRLGAGKWGTGTRLVDWPAPRYSPVAELQWERVRREVGQALWYFPHWDVPWHARPRRYVLTVHDLGHLRLPGARAARRMVTRAWLSRSTHGASRVAVISEHTKRELLAEWPALAPRVEVVSNGVEPAFFAADAAAPLPNRIASRIGDAPFMLSVGIRKRHKNLMRGVNVLERLPDLRWVIVGESFPEWREVDEAARAAGVRARMIVLDAEPDDVLRALYGAAVCLFFPSRHEGFGLPILEALAAGTPVVASNATSIPEVLGSHGLMFHPDDAEGFARGVRQVLEDRTPDPEPGRAHARKFSWENSAAKLARIFEELA